MNKIYDSAWQRNNETITIGVNFFEHLLNCLANQKFIGEPPPNGDAMAMGESEYIKVQRDGQRAIDKAWRQGMFIMSLDYKKNQEYKNKAEEYVSFWNKSLEEIALNKNRDIEEFKEDFNIAFKWGHLIGQEMWMWIKLGCFSSAIIDIENEKYEIGQVDNNDFDFIIKRRGFTPRMVAFLVKTLKYIGIGNNLKDKKDD
jgi:hypothetical protein